MCPPLILDEMIRQITIECAERGLLLLRYDLRSPTFTLTLHFAVYYTMAHGTFYLVSFPDPHLVFSTYFFVL